MAANDDYEYGVPARSRRWRRGDPLSLPVQIVGWILAAVAFIVVSLALILVILLLVAAVQSLIDVVTR